MDDRLLNKIAEGFKRYEVVGFTVDGKGVVMRETVLYYGNSLISALSALTVNTQSYKTVKLISENPIVNGP